MIEILGLGGLGFDDLDSGKLGSGVLGFKNLDFGSPGSVDPGCSSAPPLRLGLEVISNGFTPGAVGSDDGQGDRVGGLVSRVSRVGRWSHTHLWQ